MAIRFLCSLVLLAKTVLDPFGDEIKVSRSKDFLSCGLEKRLLQFLHATRLTEKERMVGAGKGHDGHVSIACFFECGRVDLSALLPIDNRVPLTKDRQHRTGDRFE